MQVIATTLPPPSIRPVAPSKSVTMFTTANCTPIQDIFPELLDQNWLKTLLGFAYFLVFALGLAGNSLVVYAMTFKGIELSVRSVFIWSLTLANFFVCFSALPLTAISTFMRHWIFGE